MSGYGGASLVDGNILLKWWLWFVVFVLFIVIVWEGLVLWGLSDMVVVACKRVVKWLLVWVLNHRGACERVDWLW